MTTLATTSVLEARGASIGYGSISVVEDLDLTVGAGEVVALLGANGAGKTTTLLGLAGVLGLTVGEVRLLGRVASGPLHQRAKDGLGFVPEERSIIRALSTRNNLRLGTGNVEDALAIFPELEALLGRKAGLLSGGEQQMLTLGRALAAKPSVLLIDELSLGLAPLVVERLLQAVRAAADHGMGVLLVEQHVKNALGVADRAYVLRRGQVVLHGDATDLRGRLDEVESLYLSDGTTS